MKNVITGEQARVAQWWEHSPPTNVAARICYSWHPITRTLANSNLPLTRSNVCFPSDHFYIILPSITRTIFWAFKKSGKNSVLASETLNFEFPIGVLYAYSLLLEADIVCYKSMWDSFTSQNSKTHALFRKFFVTALCSDLKSRSIRPFALNISILSVIKMFTVQ